MSQPGPWRPAAGAPLARTLGITNTVVLCSSKVSTFGVRSTTTTRRRRRTPERGSEWSILVPTPKTNYSAVALVQQTDVLRRTQSASPPGRSSLEVTECKLFTSPRPPLPQVHRLAARRLLKDAVREVLLRGAGHTAVGPPVRECRPLTQPRASRGPVLPNHSVKGSANGAPPGPGHRYGVHFLRPGPGGTPSSPPYLKR